MTRRIVAIGFAWMSLLAAGPARALVIVEHVVPDPWSIQFGVSFQVQVRLKWDGQGSLQGVFSSTLFDSSVLQFVSATSAPASILAYTDPDPDLSVPGMNRLLQPSIVNGALRTVQYAVGAADAFVDPRAANAPTGRLITTLTFRMISPGSFYIRGGLASGDGILGDQLIFVNTPEPGTSLLLGLGLTGMAFRRRRGTSGELRPTHP